MATNVRRYDGEQVNLVGEDAHILPKKKGISEKEMPHNAY